MTEENQNQIVEIKDFNNGTITQVPISVLNKDFDINNITNPIKLIHINEEKLKKQEKLFIEDIEVYFPYKPYEKQITYMKSIIQTLNKKYSSEDIDFNALAALESPTGTGKTLCLLCSLLAWVNTKGKVHKFSGTIIYSTRTHSQISQAISELNKTCYEPRIAILSSREFSCANSALKKSLAPSVLDIKCAREHRNCPFYKNIEYYSNKNFGNIDIEDILKQGKKKCFCPFYVERMKIKKANCDLVFMPYNYIFLKEIRESMDINIKNAILVIDEAHNVTNNCEEAQSLEVNIKDFEEMIIDLKEVYKEISKNKSRLNTPLIDFDKEMEEERKKEEGEEEKEEEINNLNDEKKERSDIYYLRIDCLLKEINLIKNIINSLTNKKEIYSERSIFKNKNYIEINADEFLSIFLNTEEQIKQIKQKESKNQTVLDTFFNNGYSNKAKEENDDYVNISPYITEQNIDKHIFFINKIIKAIMHDYSRRTKLSILHNLLQKIADILEDKNIVNSYVYCLSDEKLPTNHYIHKKVIKLNIFCFNPGIGFKDIINFKPYSIILTSGTLAPFDILEDELKIKFDTTLENEHIIDQSQYKFIIIKGYELYNKNFHFNFEYNNRSDIKSIVSLGMTIVHLCESVKYGGILVYFTSFAYLNQCYSVWGENDIISKISAVKTIYFDDKKNKNLIKDFKNNKNKNSILLSVFRGTSSEGIDFKDDFARMVICVGVPYANIVEEKVQLKKKYLDEINDKIIGGRLNGRKWYLNDAISNVNQSLGRVLRHIYDYGILVCIDERYEQKNIKNLFSKWIREKCEVVNTINDNFFDSINKFFDEQEKNVAEKKFKNNDDENIINKNANIFSLKNEEKDNIYDSEDKNNNSLFDKAFKRKTRVIEYGYEESEEPDENNNIIENNNKIEEIKEYDLNKINEENKEINCELELDNLKKKYLNDIKEKTLLNRKTNPEQHILNNEDINPNILNSKIKTNEEIIIPKKDIKNNLTIKEEQINIKNSVKNFVNEINNYKFNDCVSDFNNDKIKENKKELDNNENIKSINEDAICCVCYEIASNNPELKFSLSKCNHTLCNICWSKTLYEKLECPICRKKVRIKTLKRLIFEGVINKTNEKTNLDEKNI